MHCGANSLADASMPPKQCADNKRITCHCISQTINKRTPKICYSRQEREHVHGEPKRFGFLNRRVGALRLCARAHHLGATRLITVIKFSRP